MYLSIICNYFAYYRKLDTLNKRQRTLYTVSNLSYLEPYFIEFVFFKNTMCHDFATKFRLVKYL